MRLFIEGLEKREGYFQTYFEAFEFLGEDQGKLFIIGNNLDANFELAMTPYKDGRAGKYIIYQTPKDFLYNTLGYIAKFQSTDMENGIKTFFNKEDLDKIEILGVDVTFLERSKKIVKTYILKISLRDENDKVCMYTDDGISKANAYEFSADKVKKTQMDVFDRSLYTSINCIKFMKMSEEMQKIAGFIE